MTSEQWQKVKGLFDAALALAPARREKFLKNACGADDELRREVENLLASFDNAESFLDKPAAAEVASLIVEKGAKFKSGERIAHYEISHQIGEGGMGEVYLAKDTRLSRKVALKVLPATLTSDKSRLQRFKQEAQAASNLNHPNIITIYEIREYDGTHLIATEFVEGETLRQKLSNENPKLNEIFEIVIQLASALSVAHLAGVVHRDIKPENIMIRPDRIVKLLDFGLAKLAGADEAKLLDVSTQKLTNPGMVMGTVNYMSPEQANGAKVDRRTDLWSLGVLLYEMLAGKLPFSGKTVNHTLVAIMEQKPASFGENNRAISAELEQTVFKLLEKEPKNRYQTADDLLADLRELQARISQKIQSGETTAAFAGKAKTEKSGQSVSSIAVLPFLTLGLTEGEEYLGLGLADALITQLSQTQKLTVRPTNAVRNYTDAERDAAEIGRKLNVGAVLEGNLQRSGERLRVTVQLVKTESGATLWADKFDVNFTDFFEVQDQIAEQVSKTLLLKLNSSEKLQINKRFTENNAAYLEYLKGRHFWEKRDIENLHNSVEHFRKAIDLDPTFALAFVGLSDAYCMLGVWAEFPQDEIFPRAKAAALRALEIDEKLADAHASLGRIYSVYEWEWQAAEDAYLKAIELNPNCMNAHSWLAKVYVLKHRFDEAIEESRVAQTLDPLSPQPESSLCAAHFYARRYREAVERYRKVLRMHTDFVPALFGLGMSLAEIGEFDEAIEMQTRAVELAKNHPLIESYLFKTYAYSGKREKALEFIEKLKAMDDKLLDYQIAAIYARLDEKEKAFEYLEKAFAVPDRELSGLSIEPEFDNLRGEPRFNEMLERVGLPEAIRLPTSEWKAATDELKKNKTFVQTQKTGDRNLKTSETAPRKFAWYYAGLVLLILFLTGGAVWFYLNGGSFGLNNFFAKKPALSLQTMKINRLSDTSQATDVAISPDGEFIAFVKEENGQQSLWLRQISAPSSVKISQPAEDEIYGSPAFSPDGSHIFYLKVKSNEARATLYQIPKLGGSEKKLVEDVSLQDSGSNFSISPDGKRVAFIRLDEGFNRSLVVTDLNGANERKLISRQLPDFLTGAAFSPDGKQIAVISGSFGGRGGGIGGGKNIVLVGAEDAAEKLLSEKNWARVEGLKWLDDGSGLIVSAGEKPALFQLWHISVSDGEISRITNDLSDYAAPSLTANSTMIAAVQTNQNSNIWTVSPNEKEDAEKQLTFGNGGKDGNFGIAFAPDGEIVYVSQIGGNPDIWIVNADGSENKQLTKDAGINIFPDVSPDGKYIVFNSDRSGEGTIWRMEIDGGNPVQLAKGTMPAFSPDGKWIYFYAGRGSLWKISVAGGEPIQISVREKDIATTPVISPDNSMIACNYLVGERGAQFRIGVLSIEGGEPLKIFDTFTYAIKRLRWTADSRAVGFIETREGVSNIFKHSLDSEKSESITDFKTGTIWNFDWSNDGKKLALSRGSITKDVVLISDFR